MTSPLLDHVTAEIRAELARQRMPQRRVAEELGISEAQASERFLGRVPLDVPELERIARLLGVPVSQFFPPAARAA